MEREASVFSAGGVSAINPPKAARRPHVSIHHGRELADDYAWLRDDNWQKVMRDPARSTRKSAPISTPRTPTPRR